VSFKKNLDSGWENFVRFFVAAQGLSGLKPQPSGPQQVEMTTAT